MITDLQDYFDIEQKFFLYKVDYNMIENSRQLEEYSLNCTDSIKIDLMENIGVRLIFTRALNCEPENLFELSVSFGAILSFEEDRKDEIDWNEIDLAAEFRDNGEFVLNNLVSRTSLLIAQITSSFGQTPIVTPPTITRSN